MSCFFWPSHILQVRKVKRGFVITVIFNFIPTSCKDRKSKHVCRQKSFDMSCSIHSLEDPCQQVHRSIALSYHGGNALSSKQHIKRLSGKNCQFCFASEPLGNPRESKQYKLHHCFCVVLHTQTWTCLFGRACVNIAMVQLNGWHSLRCNHATAQFTFPGKAEMKKTINSESNMLDSMTNLLCIFSQRTWVGKGWHKHSHISFNVQWTHMSWPVMTRCIFWSSLWIALSEEHGFWLSAIYTIHWPKQRQAIGLFINHNHPYDFPLQGDLSPNGWNKQKQNMESWSKLHHQMQDFQACQSTDLQQMGGTSQWPWSCLSPNKGKVLSPPRPNFQTLWEPLGKTILKDTRKV